MLILASFPKKTTTQRRQEKGNYFAAFGAFFYFLSGRDRLRVVILKINSKEYIDGVLKSKVNFEFLVNLFVSENDRIH